MWLLYNGQQHKMINEAHIKRLKDAGAVEIDDPTVQDTLTVPEQTTEPLVSIEGDTQQENQDEPPVGDPSASAQEDSKKSKRNSKA